MSDWTAVDDGAWRSVGSESELALGGPERSGGGSDSAPHQDRLRCVLGEPLRWGPASVEISPNASASAVTGRQFKLRCPSDASTCITPDLQRFCARRRTGERRGSVTSEEA